MPDGSGVVNFYSPDDNGDNDSSSSKDKIKAPTKNQPSKQGAPKKNQK
jgi:hypothetical protein